MAINCYDCAHNLDGRCEYFDHPIGMHECPHGEKRKPKTRYDYITQTPEELAEFLDFIYFPGSMDKDWWLKWLMEEIKDA